MRLRASSSAAALCLGILLPAAQARADVVVTVQAPVRARVFFESDRRPPEMPASAAEGSAACSNVFEIEAKIESSVDVVSPTAVHVYPESFEIVTRLKSTIYLPDRAPDQLHEHEEGHRAIGEYFYRNAEVAAREAAQSLIGRSFEGIGLDRAEAEQRAGNVVLAVLKDEYMKRMHARSAAANARYDEITKHGLNGRMPAKGAVELALAEARRQEALTAQ
ncbi:MAG TPA: hypothetical protein VFL84_11620 [Gammaproteobacteria bacterium]|nr:hypothetical protein [Gammaproteobacteria bacterium]